MKKILWFSNYQFTNSKIQGTGTWLIAMGEALMQTGIIELFNITDGDVEEVTRKDCDGIIQWIVPRKNKIVNGQLSNNLIAIIKDIEEQVKPDLVHIWGTEIGWGLVAQKKIFSAPILLDIQGLLYAYASVFYGGLTVAEIFSCIGLKEIVLPKRLLYFRQTTFVKSGKIEKQIIKNISNISVQSQWVKGHVNEVNSECRIFETGILLRKQFYESKPWKSRNNINPIIFTSTSGSNTHKGLHILIRALAILKRKYPTVQLRVAGNVHSGKYKYFKDGYSTWLLSEAKRLDVLNSIQWLGPLDANSIIEQLYEASVMVVPSFVETYCLALAEAMQVGIPSVVSFAGAMPELAFHNESAMFFPVGDHKSCAMQVDKILIDPTLSDKLSFNSRKIAKERHDYNKVVKQQIDIYDSIITTDITVKGLTIIQRNSIVYD